VELLQTAITFAAPRGMRFLVEPHPFTIGMSDRVLIKLCDKLDSAHFGVTYDFCHYGVGRSKDYVAAVHALGPRIRHIHFSDSDQKSSELHFPPGHGRMDLDSLLKAFKSIGYDGTMALDLYGYPLPVQALPGAVSRMREAYEFLGLSE
jgi:sugar phosphate isomerase/epimerase